ncbi:MAG: hypothetical protein HYT80_05960 [Euryarchaeota archaeon]|nr:hypothetical protein [Euryarchaeota archaeon]
MHVVVKKWGNSYGVRLPVESAEFGRLHDGKELEINGRPLPKAKDWKPMTFRSGHKDLAENHDKYLEGMF